MQQRSLLAEVPHDETNWNESRETSAGSDELFDEATDQIFWSKLTYTGFQNRFRLMCSARALLDCALTIIEPTVDYGFHEICEFRNFSVIKSSVSTLGDKRIKKKRLYKEKPYLVSLKDAIRLCVYGKSFILPCRERPLLAGKPLHPSLARHHSTNRFLLKKKSPESQ